MVLRRELDRCLADDQTLSSVHAYWMSKMPSEGLPTRDSIEPSDIKGLLPNVGLIDVLDGGENFRYRLIGTGMVNVFGRDFTGVTLGEAHKDGEYGRFLHKLYGEAVSTRGAVYCESRFVYTSDRNMLIRRLLMPLAGPDGDVEMLFFSNTFDWSLHPTLVTSGSTELGMNFPSEEIKEIVPLRRAYGNPAAA